MTEIQRERSCEKHLLHAEGNWNFVGLGFPISYDATLNIHVFCTKKLCCKALLCLLQVLKLAILFALQFDSSRRRWKLETVTILKISITLLIVEFLISSSKASY